MTEMAGEQTRARYPDSSGYTERAGVRLYYEVYGSGEPTIFLLPTWSIIHSRHWKMQIAYLARHCRVVTFDGRGNGWSDRPATGYDEHEFAADARAVLAATGTGRAVIVSLSLGAQRALLLAAEQPERVAGAVFIAPAVPLGPTPLDDPAGRWDTELSTDEGQNFHVRHRLERYGAGRCMDYQLARPAESAAAIATEIGREARYRPVATDGAARAATMLASLL
jgi:pimeloyl-ACP methyl ester carboxylesterase